VDDTSPTTVVAEEEVEDVEEEDSKVDCGTATLCITDATQQPSTPEPQPITATPNNNPPPVMISTTPPNPPVNARASNLRESNLDYFLNNVILPV
jgi:hypothetical protein